MGTWVERHWTPSDAPALSRRSRSGGPYHAYVPDTLRHRDLAIPAELSRRAAQVERKILDLSRPGGGHGLEGIARFLLRSEAIASSRIEGLAPAPDKVAMAELAQREEIAGFSRTARLVANNVSVLRKLGQTIGESMPDAGVTVDEIVALHAGLLGDERLEGLRTTQNWIGGSSWTPIDAEFVPPPPEMVPDLVLDLADYMSGAEHGALIQAGIVHAQFETIHPFGDGNGRIGRALIHAVLQRRGLTPSPVLPVSMVLGTWSDRYVDGLTAFRSDDRESAEMADATGLARWLSTFVEAADIAVEQADDLSRKIGDLAAEWDERYEKYRMENGKRRALRVDSADARILAGLPDTPVLTSATAADDHGVSAAAARRALDDLAEAGILRKRSMGKRTYGFVADELLDLVTIAERRLASTRFDTALAPPTGRAVPERPNHGSYNSGSAQLGP